jgi:hypothetical protein
MERMKGDFIEIKIRGQDYKVLHKGKYQLGDTQSMYNLLSLIEKYTGKSISYIISIRQKWI